MSSRLVVTTRRADEDIADAAAYYLEAGAPDAAEDFVDALEAAIHLLMTHPSIGSPRFAVELDIPELRSLPLKRYPYVVFYSEDAGAARVHRVLHTSRDLPSEFA